MISNVIRDRLRKIVTSELEPKRQALRLIIKQKDLPLNTRIKAQLELQKLPRYSALVGIEDRCIVGGRTRNLIQKLSPIEFRNRALNGDIPGVKRSLW
jgi:small subunit ribosomal protein S14